LVAGHKGGEEEEVKMKKERKEKERKRKVKGEREIVIGDGKELMSEGGGVSHVGEEWAGVEVEEKRKERKKVQDSTK